MDATARQAVGDMIVDGLLNLIQTEIAYQNAINPDDGLPNGPRPSYSLDGQSFDWPGWLAAMQDRISKQLEQNQRLGGPAAWAGRRMIART